MPASRLAAPVGLIADVAMAERLLGLVASVPTPVWGRDELGTGEMWNSNSVTAWLLASAGLDTSALRPPPCGRALGWRAASSKPLGRGWDLPALPLGSSAPAGSTRPDRTVDTFLATPWRPRATDLAELAPAEPQPSGDSTDPAA